MARSSFASVSLGATCTDNGVRFRVWAPERKSVRVLYPQRQRTFELGRNAEGYFSGHDPAARAGELYDFQLDGQDVVPDPASRFQPQGIFGPSMVVDPEKFSWKCRDWQRPPARGRAIYELHVGTFSTVGTFLGAIGHLDELADLGVNTIELMPVHEFPDAGTGATTACCFSRRRAATERPTTCAPWSTRRTRAASR